MGLMEDLNLLDQAISHPRMSKERGDDVYGAYGRLHDALHKFVSLEAERDALRARLDEVEPYKVDYEYLRDAIDNYLHVEDGEESESYLLGFAVEHAAAQLKEKDQQLADAEPIIAAVAEDDISWNDHYDNQQCFWCIHDNAEHAKDIKHKPDCPITQARAYQAKYARADADNTRQVFPCEMVPFAADAEHAQGAQGFPPVSREVWNAFVNPKPQDEHAQPSGGEAE